MKITVNPTTPEQRAERRSPTVTIEATTEREKLMLRGAADVTRLKGYFPYRICWFAFHPETLDYQSGANVTRRQVNDLIRKGYEAYS